MTIRTLLTLTLAAAPVWAQEAPLLSGPTSGFAFDEQSRTLRVINGVPGAAYLGPAIASDVDFATVSPDGTLAVTLREGKLALLRLQTGESAALGSSEPVDSAAWSGDSSAVALAGSSFSLYRNLKSAPESAAVARLSAKAQSIATDGAGIFVATEDGVYLLNASEARLIASLEDASALVLSGDTLYAASRGRKQVDTIRHWAESAEIATLASGIEDPSALALSRDGAVVFVASRAAKSLFALKTATGEPLETLQLDFEPTRADRLNAGLFRLNARASAQDPIQILDSKQRAVFFIPTQDLSYQAPVSVED